MKTKIIEASDRDKFNWGKFLIDRFDDEWQRRGQVDDSGQPLLSRQGWGPEHVYGPIRWPRRGLSP